VAVEKLLMQLCSVVTVKNDCCK